MKKFVLLFTVLALFACGEEEQEPTVLTPEEIAEAEQRSLDAVEERRQQVRDLEARMFDTLATMDPKFSQELLLTAMSFVNEFPKDEDADDFLMIAIRASKGLGDHRVTIDYIDRLITQYPNYPYLPAVYYMKAYTLDFEMNKVPEAKEAYAEVLRLYPDYVHADEISERLLTIDKTDLDLIREFEKNQEVAGDSFGV